MYPKYIADNNLHFVSKKQNFHLRQNLKFCSTPLTSYTPIPLS